MAQGLDKIGGGLYNGDEKNYYILKHMREGKRGGFDINPRRTAVSETKGLFGGHGNIPDEFRPTEDVEAEESSRGQRKHIDLNEISDSAGDEYLTAEDKMTAELDKKRDRDSEEAARLLREGLIKTDDDEGDSSGIASDSFDSSSVDATYEESQKEDDSGGGPIVFDSPVKKSSRHGDVTNVRAKEFSKKGQRLMAAKAGHPEKPLYKDARKGKTTKW